MKEMQKKFIDAYMDTAIRFSQLSKATRLKVGAIIVKDNRIMSVGYNGLPSGWDDSELEIMKDGELKTNPLVFHAEENAILKLARDGDAGNGSSLFCTHACCVQCAKLIYGAGVKQFFYKEDYKSSDGINFLSKVGVEVIKMDN